MPIDTVYMSMDMPCHAMLCYYPATTTVMLERELGGGKRRRRRSKNRGWRGDHWSRWGEAGAALGHGNREERGGRRVTETVIWRPSWNGGGREREEEEEEDEGEGCLMSFSYALT